MSSVVTSSQRQAKHLPCPGLAPAAAGGSALTPLSAVRLRASRASAEPGAVALVAEAQGEGRLGPGDQARRLGVVR